MNDTGRMMLGRHLRLLLGGAAGTALLAAAALATSVALAETSTSDPDWAGSPPENISQSDTNRAWHPDIAADASGEAVIVWSDETAADGRDIYYASGAGGIWSSPQVVSDTAHDSLFPYVLAVGDRYFVAWIDDLSPGKHVLESQIGTGATREIPSPVAPEYVQPCLGASTDRLHVVFSGSDRNIPDLYHSSRPLLGTSWPLAERIYTSTAVYGSVHPALAIGPDGSTLHLVWENKDTDLRSILYMSGTISGAAVAWSPSITLSTGITLSIRPDIAVASDGDIHVVWGEVGEAGYEYEQYARHVRYDAGIGSWDLPAVRIDPVLVQVHQDSPTYIGPAIGVWQAGGGDTQVCVAWHGFRAGDPGAEEVLMRCSSDAGETWAGGTVNVSRSTTQSGWEVSIRPLIAFDSGGTVHAVWQERAGSNVTEDYEVFYSASWRQVFVPLIVNGN
jgi:hypothetical protein